MKPAYFTFVLFLAYSLFLFFISFVLGGVTFCENGGGKAYDDLSCRSLEVTKVVSVGDYYHQEANKINLRWCAREMLRQGVKDIVEHPNGTISIYSNVGGWGRCL